MAHRSYYLRAQAEITEEAHAYSSDNQDTEWKIPLAATNEDNDSSRTRFRDWRSWKVKIPYTSAVAALGTLLLAIIAALAFLSQKHDGFVTVPGQERASIGSSSRNHMLDQALLWTSLPSVVITIYNLAWYWMASAAIDRQPFVELGRKKPVAASKSLALDYRTMLPGIDFITAVRNGHFLVSGLIVTGIVMSFMSAAAAHLVALRSVVHGQAITVTVETAFNASLLDYNTTQRDVLEQVSATRLHGADFPPWTDGQYAFPSLSLPDVDRNTNMTVETTAFAAYLDCKVIDSSAYVATLMDTPDDVYSGGRPFSVVAMDRGCSVNATNLVYRNYGTYIHLYMQSFCDDDSHRFGLLSYTYTPESVPAISNLSMISCIPEYWNLFGTLRLGVRQDRSHAIDSFTSDTTESQGYKSDFGGRYEFMLALGYIVEGTLQTSDLGFLVYEGAQKRSPEHPLEVHALLDSLTELYTTTFAVMGSTKLYGPNTGPNTTATAEVLQSVQRLFVYRPVALILCTVLFCSVICAIGVLLYSVTHHSILCEEPYGLISYAQILMGSNVDEVLQQGRYHHPNGQAKSGGSTALRVDEFECRAEYSSDGAILRIQASY
jgi:hypothetical protein